MDSALEALIRRRLLIVTGKGGTGKTSVAAALGLLSAAAGLETLLVEVTESAQIPELFGSQPASQAAPDDHVPRALAPHLHALRIRPEQALEEYLGIQLHVRALPALLMRSSGFRLLLDAAPGWRALITLGKLWHLQEQRDERGSPRWQLLIVDGPSTGHGISFLSVPKVVLDSVRLGPLRRHTEGVQNLLQDPQRTLVLPVTLAEELPTNETIQLCQELKDLGLAIGPVVVNAIEGMPEAGLEPALLASLPPPPLSTPAHGLLDPEVVRACLDHATRRAELHRRFLAVLAAATAQAPIALPYLPEGIEDLRGLTELAAHLEKALVDWEDAG